LDKEIIFKQVKFISSRGKIIAFLEDSKNYIYARVTSDLPLFMYAINLYNINVLFPHS